MKSDKRLSNEMTKSKFRKMA